MDAYLREERIEAAGMWVGSQQIEMQRGNVSPTETTKLKITETKFSMSQVAKLMGVHRITILRLLDAGKLGCYQIGDRRIVAESHLQEFLSLVERKAIVQTMD